MNKIVLMVVLATALVFQGCVSTSKGPKTAAEERSAAKIYTDLGLGYLRQGKLELALKKLETALEYNNDSPEANHYIAEVYKQMGDMENANKYFREAVKLAPRDPMLLNNYGAFLCEESRFDDAEEYFVRAATTPRYRTPEYAYENLALCALRTEKKAKAEEYFRKALVKNPRMPKSLYQMSVLNLDRGDYFRARAFLERFHGAVGETEQSLALAIKIERGLGNEDVVKEYQQKLETKYPQSELINQ